MTQEEIEHKMAVDYLKLLSRVQGEILFTSDMSGIFLGEKNDKRAKIRAAKAASLRGRKAIPDIHIFEPRGEFCGLFIEMKSRFVTVFKKTGGLKKDEHLQAQYDYILLLRERGYFADFALGFDQAKKMIDEYFKQKKHY